MHHAGRDSLIDFGAKPTDVKSRDQSSGASAQCHIGASQDLIPIETHIVAAADHPTNGYDPRDTILPE